MLAASQHYLLKQEKETENNERWTTKQQVEEPCRRRKVWNARTPITATLTISPIVLNQHLGKSRGLPRHRLTGPIRVSPLGKAITLLPVSSTDHHEPSFNHSLFRKTAYDEAIVLWACPKHFPNTLIYSDSILVLKTDLENPAPYI